MSIENLPPLMRPKPFAQKFGRRLGDAPRRVLDVGCFEGRNSLHFARLGHEVIGISLETAELKVARQAAAEEDLANCSFVAANALAMPFAPSSFDAVAANELLHAVPRSEAHAIVRNIQSLTAPNGMNAISGYFVGDFTAPNDNTWLRPGELVDLYDRPGWRILDVQEDLPDMQNFGDGQIAVNSLSRIIAQRVDWGS